MPAQTNPDSRLPAAAANLNNLHPDDELGPRGTGAPSGILDAPADLPYHVGLAAQSLQDRVGDPVGTLLAPTNWGFPTAA